jgi:hypothetical protein
MRLNKTSTTAHLLRGRKITPSAQHTLVYDELVKLLKKYENRLEVKSNTIDQEELWTTHIFRSSGSSPKFKKGILFASVIIHQKFTSLYFHPLYIDPELKTKLTEKLKGHLKGETCFHFNTVSVDLLSDLDELIQLGWDSYKKIAIVY